MNHRMQRYSDDNDNQQSAIRNNICVIVNFIGKKITKRYGTITCMTMHFKYRSMTLLDLKNAIKKND